MTVLTIGVFVAIPMWHAYGRLKTPRQLKIALAFTFAAIMLLILTTAAPTDAQGNTTGFLGALAGLVGLTNFVCGLVAVGLVRGQAYPGGTAELAFDQTLVIPAPDEGVAADDPSVASALEERQRREGARGLAQRDPLLAHELHIGRPDRGGDYDDGGLVDLNSAPAALIATALEVDEATVAAIIEARLRFRGFTNLDEVVTCVALTAGQEALLRDRGVVLPL